MLWMLVRIGIVLGVLFAQENLLFADETDNTSSTKTISSFRADQSFTKKNPMWYERFQPYKMNYAIWQWTSGDDMALEGQYSFKYDLKNTIKVNTEKQFTNNIFVAYSGKFDFYLATRESGPVINRTSNPSLHYRHGYQTGLKSICWDDNEGIERCSTDPNAAPTHSKPKEKFVKGNSWWYGLGFEHRSDGQVTDAKARDLNPASPTYGKYLAQIQYERGNHEYFDGISVGANYFIIPLMWKYTDLDNNNIQYVRDKIELEGKIYVTNDSDVTWGPYAGTGRRFSDYDLVKISYSHSQMLPFAFFKDVTFGVEYDIGAKAFTTDSIDLYLVAPFYLGSTWKFPLFVKSHFGPMDRLSNYTQSMRSVGVGLALAY